MTISTIWSVSLWILRYNLYHIDKIVINLWKYFFYVVILCPLQARRKLTKNWWFLTGSCTSTRDMKIYSEKQWTTVKPLILNEKSVPYVSWRPCGTSTVGSYKHMVDFTNRFLLPEWVYGQTLLGCDQSGNDFKNFTVNMTVNGSVNIQKFKFRKLMNMMTEAKVLTNFSIWVSQTVRGDA